MNGIRQGTKYMQQKLIITGSSLKECPDNTVGVEYSITKEHDGVIKKYVLKYQFEKEYADYICSETADGVVVTLLPYAIRAQYQIESKLPVTEELYYRLQYQLIPQLTLCAGIAKEISISCDTVKPDWNPTAVATAMSCGVDSFATLFENLEKCSDDYRITHLTFFENGAHHSGVIGHSKKEEKVFNKQLEWVKKYCDDYGRKLITVRSNLDELLSKLFWNDSYDRTHTYRNAGFVLLLQKLIKIYYYSPGHNVDDFKCSLTKDSALYERLILPNVSTRHTCFYNSNCSMTRLEKIRYISAFKETYDNLLVCYAGNNCGKCLKCRRTLLELYVTGNLDKYSHCFDTAFFKQHLQQHLIWLLSKRHDDPLMQQIIACAKANGIPLPWYYYMAGDLRAIPEGVGNIIRKRLEK